MPQENSKVYGPAEMKCEYSLMITVIRSAVSEMKEGNSANYEQLVRSLNQYSKGIVDIKKLRVWIMAFAHNAFHLDECCVDLIDVIFNLNWAEHDNNLALAYIMFLSSLISSHPSLYKSRILQMLVQKFAFRPDETGRIPNHLEKINGRVHTAVKSIIKIIPNSVDELYKLVVQEFPHKTEPLYVQVTYLKNLLQLLDYINELQFDVLQLIFSRLIQIDVQGKLKDIKDLEDSIPEYNISLYGDGNNPDSLNSETYQKLSTIQTNKGQEEIYKILMNIFEKQILCTCKSRYVQFIIFWYISLDGSFSRRFITLILRKALGEQESEIIKLAATQYLASFAARAKFLGKQELHQMFHIIGNWVEGYISKYKISIAYKQAKQNKHFYSVLTAIIYVFCYRWKDLTNKNGWCKESDWVKTILNSKFKPLEMCTRSIVEVFIYIANKVKFLQCSTDCGTHHDDDEEEESLWEVSTFFPFDPFGLKTSQHYLNDIYIHWEGFPE
ncbi:8909_t:CDS:2 [Entrophospora sp. SA101]|nr:8905_t:CDS:2 [Entrophospora sp. SA101]CAJ0625818.1 8909_t:CDS:2 [Entrophospora sp. SA101]